MLLILILIPITLIGCGEDEPEKGIEGTVSGERGEPLAGVNVKIIKGPSSQSDTTDSFGKFFFGDLPNGEYTLRAQKIGYESQTLDDIIVADNIVQLDIPPLIKERAQTISGTVIDKKTGKPIKDAQITTTPITESITTDDTGQYIFGGKQRLLPGGFTVHAKADGYQDAKIAVKVEIGEPTRADIKMTSLEPILKVTPKDRLDFGAERNGLKLIIENDGTGTLEWKITAPSEKWIKLEKFAGTATKDSPDTVEVSVNRDGLEPKEHNLNLSITSNGGIKQILVLMDVDPNPILAVKPNQLDFDLDRQDLNLTIENIGTGALTWQISIPEDWASAEETEGETRQTPSTVKITIDRTKRKENPGKHSQIITITSDGGDTEISIAMEVHEAPKLAVEPEALDFGSSVNSIILTIKNSGTGVLGWNITSPAGNWMTIAPTSGSTDDKTPSTVDVQVNRERLDAGIYTPNLIVASDGGDVTIPISMIVDKPILSVSPQRLRFDPFTETQILTISRRGFSELEFELIPNERWIIVKREVRKISDQPIEVEIGVDRRELPQGVTFASIELRSDSAQNSPLEIPVEVEVLPTFRLILRDARTNTPINGAMALEQLTDADGVIELENVDQREISGKIEIEGYIDRDFSMRLDETTDRIVELVVDLTPIPAKIDAIRSGDFNLPLELAVSGDGSFAYVTNNWGNSVTQIRTNSDTVAGTLELKGDGEEPMGIAVHPLTGEIYVANSFVPPIGVGVQNDTISIIPESLNRSTKVTVGNKPIAVAVDENENWLYVANRDSHTISVIDLDTRRLIHTIDQLNESPGRMAIVRGDLYVAGENGVMVIDTRTRTVTRTIRNVGQNPVDLAVSMDEQFVYVVNNGSGNLSVIDTMNHTVIETIEVGPLPVRIAVTEGFGVGVEALLYVVNQGDSTVTMIERTESEWRVAEEVIRVGFNPQGIAAIAGHDKIYVVIQEDGIIEVLGFRP